MDGSETKDDLDCCAIWDYLFQFRQGARDVREIAHGTKIHANRVAQLVKHPWFNIADGLVSIAKLKGRKAVAA